MLYNMTSLLQKINTKQNTLIPGDNITITGDTISAIGGGGTSGTAETLGDQVFYAVSSVSSVIGSGTSYISSFDTIQKTNTELYTHTNDIITVLKSGYYKVEFNCNFQNFGYNDRAVIRTTVLINNVNDITSGGQSTCYIRDNDFGTRGTNNNSLFFNLNANDTIRLENTLNIATSTGFNSDFSNFEFSNGSNILISRLDVTAVTSDGTFLQGKLTAGDNITITGDVISASGGGGGGGTLPSFNVIPSQTSTITGADLGAHLPYDIIFHDSFHGYDTNTFEYTIQVAGDYLFYYSCGNANGIAYATSLRKNDILIDRCLVKDVSLITQDFDSLGGKGLVINRCALGDKIKVTCNGNTRACTLDAPSFGPVHSFGGFLIG